MKAARWRRKVSPARWNPAFTIGAGATLVYLAVLAPGIYSIDGNAMLGLTESLIRHFSIVLPPDCAGVIGRGGHLYSMWYPLLSFVAIPFVLVGMALAHVLHLPEHFVSAVCALTLSAVLTGATTALVALVAVRLGANWRGAWLAAIAYAFGTIALCYARSFYCEPLLAFLTVAGMWLAMSEVRRRILWITVCAALAVLAKPPGIILGPILSAYFFAKRRPWAEIIAPTFGAATGFVLYGIYNFVRFGSALNFGQPTMFSLRYVPVGVAGLLFSPGRGFVWYCVPLLLFVVALPRAIRLARLEAAMIAVMFLGCLGLYSCWMSWPGGWSGAAVSLAGAARTRRSARTLAGEMGASSRIVHSCRIHRECTDAGLLLRALLCGGEPAGDRRARASLVGARRASAACVGCSVPGIAGCSKARCA